jgi:hypothetical protein
MIPILLALALTGAADVPQPADVGAAKDWVELLDRQDWNGSWNHAGTVFKSRLPQARWVSTIETVREPLGPVASRSVKSITKKNVLPGAPPGDYELVQFQTQFAHKSGAIETVLLDHEASGWKVDGYFIR